MSLQDDFDTQESSHPFRCAKCSKMQPRGSLLVWVSDSAHWLKGDGYNRLAVTSAQEVHKSGWCERCVEKTKSIKDDFPAPVRRMATAGPAPVIFDPSAWTGR